MFLSAYKATLEMFSPLFFLRARAVLPFAPRFAILGVLGLLTLGISGGSVHAAGRPMGVAELEKELGHYQKILSLEANFEQVKELKGVQVKLRSSGTFQLRREGESATVEWRVSKPAYLKLRITPSALEIFEEEGKPGKPLVSNQEAQEKVLRPLYAWLSVNPDLIQKEYKVFSLANQGFRLEPNDDKSPVKAIRIMLDRKQLVSSVRLEERSGDEIRIEFSGTKVAKAP